MKILKCKRIILFTINLIFWLIFLVTIFVITSFYSSNIPTFIVFFIVLDFIFYLLISILSVINFTHLISTLESLEASKLHIHTLKSINDSLRTFKHDFFNIMQSIDGYIYAKDYASLETYYKDIKTECDSLNTMSYLSPEFIDEPAVFNLVINKFYKAETLRYFI